VIVRTVLVVDDEWAIADWLQSLLTDEGYDVLVASNGKQALELLRRQDVDLVLSDFMMPILDGPALAGQMAADPAMADIPIVIMSALQEAAVRQRIDRYRRFLRKPFREADVLQAVRYCLGPHQVGRGDGSP
jgi:two-component system chemotaxis sensor kinase CheA